MPTRRHFCQTLSVALCLAVGWVVVAGDGSRSPETDLAAPGAPLYQYAVSESVKTLMSKQEQAELGAAGRPPSPGPDYYWCENHKAYHKKQTPGSPQQPAAAQTPGAIPAPPAQPDGSTAAKPPSPGAGYYWCENCKSYHQGTTNQTSASVQGSAVTPASGEAPPTGTQSYWC